MKRPADLPGWPLETPGDRRSREMIALDRIRLIDQVATGVGRVWQKRSNPDAFRQKGWGLEPDPCLLGLLSPDL